jgi:hypothetical protein
VISEHDVTNILEPFFQILSEEVKQHAYFQWDKATQPTHHNNPSRSFKIFPVKG